MGIGVLTLHNLFRTSMMSSVSSPTDMAAYREYSVNEYSWMNAGLKQERERDDSQPPIRTKADPLELMD